MQIQIPGWHWRRKPVANRTGPGRYARSYMLIGRKSCSPAAINRTLLVELIAGCQSANTPEWEGAGWYLAISAQKQDQIVFIAENFTHTIYVVMTSVMTSVMTKSAWLITLLQQVQPYNEQMCCKLGQNHTAMHASMTMHASTCKETDCITCIHKIRLSLQMLGSIVRQLKHQKAGSTCPQEPSRVP